MKIDRLLGRLNKTDDLISIRIKRKGKITNKKINEIYEGDI